MPTHTPAYHRFAERLREVRHLYQLCRAYEAAKAKVKLEKKEHVNALIRSAIVMLSAHIQGFVEDYADQIIEQLVKNGVDRSKLPDRLFYYATRKSIDAFRLSTEPDTIIGRLRDFDVSFRGLVLGTGPLSEAIIETDYKDGFGNPTSKEIGKFLRRFGYETFQADMKSRLKGKFLFAENAVNYVVGQRSKIAHGDVTATTTSKDFRAYLQLVEAYCAAADYSAAKHFKQALACRLW